MVAWCCLRQVGGFETGTLCRVTKGVQACFEAGQGGFGVGWGEYSGPACVHLHTEPARYRDSVVMTGGVKALVKVQGVDCSEVCFMRKFTRSESETEERPGCSESDKRPAGVSDCHVKGRNQSKKIPLAFNTTFN